MPSPAEWSGDAQPACRQRRVGRGGAEGVFAIHPGSRMIDRALKCRNNKFRIPVPGDTGRTPCGRNPSESPGMFPAAAGICRRLWIGAMAHVSSITPSR
jgi:hypothetical protein